MKEFLEEHKKDLSSRFARQKERLERVKESEE